MPPVTILNFSLCNKGKDFFKAGDTDFENNKMIENLKTIHRCHLPPQVFFLLWYKGKMNFWVGGINSENSEFSYIYYILGKEEAQ